MRYNFKVYKKKINIFYKRIGEQFFSYFCSSNAYPSCKVAKHEVAKQYGGPGVEFKAGFAK